MSLDINSIEIKMNKAMDSLEHEFTKVRTGRANPKMLDNVVAEAYGSVTSLNQMALITVPDAHQLLIKPFDPSNLQSIEIGINNANLGINPTNDGEVIRLNIPSLTEDTRKQLVKEVKAYGEEAKVKIRNARQDGMNIVKKDTDMTDDMKKEAEVKIQDLTNKFNKLIDEKVKKKDEEVMTI